ncbi:hypothetical protein COW36_06240 [bacterium (Candidatus Blackallbacteria) CG17_big_fil_post_rev_8_21_14_2_50_48_46]|uniref:Spore protein YkvP/CgeB glycosyl transferase-like domain-containing protein n=1 Tax=bacterium (Candidatus Blackallbacteria) CG17_big_fil_post_rev_8_21_14_2_50_48_46 TaxID=2014261 RepID=A0A2M7G7S8_9BACT|nr:MAG: hypothetical protein COW64_17070 [bacterium (Candidatus Blackallbacteria) CG18_big_fil_WC_8_21_14_2_50_49_26]PIW18125.1 MAG: hypothetical protein COW36_06240 [bacterium (Candidatus Blackallbacteria) CG17_big_fil_post_rev_8_21_14_2_50_48_46]PIW51134.1 MAG: hypothetical protein COW20_00390 [bacterium (Candidatus Blackallbacteria) CG13_big_fil_rev_8_21_14_2_50_49_14]
MVLEESPYKLLIGPLFNPELIGKYNRDPNIKLFMPRSFFTQRFSYDIVYSWENFSHFDKILEALPSGWSPDLVIWWDILYQGLPPGIEQCPYPTVLIPGDWNLAYLTTLDFAKVFDITLADTRLMRFLQAAGLDSVFHWPGFSFDPATMYRNPESEFRYDVSFIGNLNEAIHPQRSLLLDQVLALQERYQIFVQQGLWGEDYRRVLNQSRIVLNYTIAQVMNMRAYEAPACGALLFIEEANEEIPFFLTDRQECIYYRADNLIELLEYYLSHEPERAQIAEAGYQKIQNFSYEKQFRRILEMIPEILPLAEERKTYRLKGQLTGLSQFKFRALRQFIASQPEALQSAIPILYEALNQLQSETMDEQMFWRLNALGAMLMPLGPVTEQNRKEWELAKRCFEQGLQFAPLHPIFHYHLALCQEAFHEIQKALWHFSRCVELMAGEGRQYLMSYRSFILPFFRSRGRELLAIEWERVSFELQNDIPALDDAYIHLLMSEIWYKLGILLKKSDQREKAFKAFENAYLNFPDSRIFIPWIEIEILLGHEDRAWERFQEGLKLQPFLISHLERILTPYLFFRNFNEIQVWVARYQGVFSELSALHAICQLLLLTQSKSFNSNDLIVFFQVEQHQQPDFLERLRFLCGDHPSFLSSPSLSALLHKFTFAWSSSLEKTPRLAPDSGLLYLQNSEEAQLKILEQGNSAGEYLRSLEFATDLKLRRLGPDLIPFQFLGKDEIMSLSQDCSDWMGECQSVFLLLADTFNLTELRLFLSEYEKHFAQNSEQGCLIWTTEQSGSCYLLCEELIAESNLSILDEKLSLEEQGALLAAVDCIVASPQNAGLFYLCWGLFQAKPIWITQEPAVEPWPGQDFWAFKQWQESDWQAGFQKYSQLGSWQELAKKQAHEIGSAYMQAGEKVLNQAFWKVRLDQLGLLG